MLKALGMSCLAVRDGGEAISAVESQGDSFGIVILDIMMPGPPTSEVVRRLAKWDATLPIVIATGWDRSRVNPIILKSPNVRRILHKP
jgi:CheY-like chemotaxis protein